MRRVLVSSLALGLALAVVAPTTPNAMASGDHRAHRSPASRASEPTAPAAESALARARSVLAGNASSTRDATLTLRDLFTSRSALAPADRAAARQVVARPAQARETCSRHVCVHWQSSGRDGATDRWARRTLTVMGAVWHLEIGHLGYRAPAPDDKGGDPRLDVYLKDVGAQGLYGYCDPEQWVPGSHRQRASGYCVLDNDFSRAQFATAPVDALRVTAAHEFFHASQFNYDVREDHWFMEATATWMEERFADEVNDNRQYLSASQVAAPTEPLDTFDQYGSNQYGNWVFFEYLSQRWGLKIVRRAWEEAVGRKRFSVRAIAAALPGHHTLDQVYGAFAAANTTPAASYEEGRHWPRASVQQVSLGADETATNHARIDHLANVPLRVRPRSDLDTDQWDLQVDVAGPPSATSPEASVVWQDHEGDVHVYRVPLDDAGVGQRVVPFNRPQVERMYVVLTNASTRYDCAGHDPTYSCSGTPRDDGQLFTLDLQVLPR